MSQIDKLFSEGKTLSFSKDEIIIRPEDVPRGVFLLQEGFIKTYTITKYGERNIQLISGPGDLFPLLWTLGNLHREVYYQTMTPVSISRIQRKELKQKMQEQPELVQDINQQLLKLYGTMAERIQNLELRSARERIIFRLCIIGREYGEDRGKKRHIIAPFTHQDIADSINMSRETASREIAKLEKQKIVSYQGHKLIIDDYNKLKDLI